LSVGGGLVDASFGGGFGIQNKLGTAFQLSLSLYSLVNCEASK